MKRCPTCATVYDDAEMLFCTNDGSPLVDVPAVNQTPNPPFVPDEDETVILRPKDEDETVIREKFVVPLTAPEPPPTPVSARTVVAPPLKKKSNGALLAILALLGAFGLLAALGVGGYFMFSGGNSNSETARLVNGNQTQTGNGAANSDANSNLDLFPNVNSNSSNANSGNANARPSPSGSPSPKPSPSASPSANANRNANANSGATNTNINANIAPRPSPSVAASASPRPSPSAAPTVLPGGVVNGKATNLPRPTYPAAAKAARISGAVNVQVLIDEDGNVTSASATSGNPLLRSAAVQAARQAKFAPTLVRGQRVKVSGTIVYNFVL